MAKKVLIPLDGSKLAERAIEAATRFMDRDGTLVLARVLEFPEITMWAAVDAISTNRLEEEAVLEYLSKLKADWTDKGFKVETFAPPGPGQADSIVNLADQEKVDMIVMSSHGRTGFSRVLLGSVAEKVVRLSKVPIFILKPQGGEEEE